MLRRKFLKDSVMAGVGTGLFLSAPAFLQAGISRRKDGPLGVALIGCKGMGWANLMSMLKVEGTHCVAICDIDQNIIQSRFRELKEKNIEVKTYGDYREMLKNKDVDIVIVGTPDHWHCLQAVHALQAGKDVYVEKPVANSVAEALIMEKASVHHGRIVQVNQWQRSNKHFQDAVAYVHSGKLGNIYSVKTWFFRGGGKGITPAPDGPVPEGVDYNMWLGPAPKRPFNKNRFHYDFRWFWDYAGGLMTDWGVHLLDVALWGMKAGEPLSAVASGAKYQFPDDAKETPDNQTTVYDYGKFQLTWEHSMGKGKIFGHNHGIAFIGEKGTLIVNRSGWEVVPETEKKDGQQVPMIEAVSWQPRTDDGLDNHTVNFINAVRQQNPSLLNCPIQAGVKVATHCHLGNIALRSGQKIFWDGNRRTVTNKGIDNMVKPVYHNGWKFPSVG